MKDTNDDMTFDVKYEYLKTRHENSEQKWYLLAENKNVEKLISERVPRKPREII